jgi:hypothetical protein
MCAEMHISFHIKWLLKLVYLKTKIASQISVKVSQYQISQKSVEWYVSCFTYTQKEMKLFNGAVEATKKDKVIHTEPSHSVGKQG